ncbi:MAG: [FeFe] hydrogenase H-cluster maturation GTPase HydF [Bacteroidota bacterium]|nr:[FeFe] hydrogenase H-cluster maturation GTPase HydF [Bacteroidota bacterium]
MQQRENRLQVGFFGRCNVGKSSLINLISNQNTAIVSSIKGTTTDVVKKSIELNDFGAITLVDTAGVDDESILGKERKNKTLQTFSQVDLAVVVIGENIFSSFEEEIIEECKKYSLPYIIIYNKQDLYPITQELAKKVSLVLSKNEEKAREKLCSLIKTELQKIHTPKPPLLHNIVGQGDVILLVTPIDSSAPKGRLILPQVKTIREILDQKAISIVVQTEQIQSVLDLVGKDRIKLVITDSQVFNQVNKLIPQEIKLTSFSILLAKEKGNFEAYLQGSHTIDFLQEGDKVLILESCTHTPTCEDIGRVKLPKLLEKYTNKHFDFEIKAGLNNDFSNIEEYKLVIQCGGCMATEKQMHSRLKIFLDRGIPVTNYGMAISYANGIFHRAVEVFL